jgi:hypothetical protein
MRYWVCDDCRVAWSRRDGEDQESIATEEAHEKFHD